MIKLANKMGQKAISQANHNNFAQLIYWPMVLHTQKMCM